MTSVRGCQDNVVGVGARLAGDRGDIGGGDTGPVRTGRTMESGDGQPSRAVSRNRKSGRPRVSGVGPDRFDHEIEFVGTVDLARYAVSHIGLDERGFIKVAEPVNVLRVEVRHREHLARWDLRRREREPLALS